MSIIVHPLRCLVIQLPSKFTKTNHPILIIHGDKDTVVPYTMSEELYKKHPDKIRYELFPGADHGMSYIVDKPRYQRILKEFLSK